MAPQFFLSYGKFAETDLRGRAVVPRLVPKADLP
jgi:hypothetical protein